MYSCCSKPRLNGLMQSLEKEKFMCLSMLLYTYISGTGITMVPKVLYPFVGYFYIIIRPNPSYRNHAKFKIKNAILISRTNRRTHYNCKILKPCNAQRSQGSKRIRQ